MNDHHHTHGLRRRSLLRLAPALSLAGLGTFAGAQELGSRSQPVHLVVPFPAGGPTDAIARLAADALAPSLGPVVVENKAGAAGGIAAEVVNRAPPDGRTLLVAGQGLMFINKPLYKAKKLAYDPDTDYAYLGMLGSFPNVIVCHPDVPAHTIGELVALARAHPGTISYGSNGIGSLTHLTAEILANAAGVKFLHVPYQGAAPQMTDLLSNRINFSIVASQGVMGLIQQKKVRPLAVSTGQRFSELPDVPTLVESGFPMLDVPVWFAVFAPAATPAPVLAKLRAAMAAATGTPGYVSELAKRHAQPMPLSVEASDAVFARERKLWAQAVHTTGASAE